MQLSEPDLWEALYSSNSDHVFAYASRRVGPEEAADIVAETFLAAWRRIDDVPDDALPWLYAAAKNVINNSRRAEMRRDALWRRLVSAEVPVSDHDPAAEVEARTDIVAAMRFLPEPEREALMLVAWEDLEPRRAAAAMGCSPGTFAVRVHRGRRHLMKILSSGGSEPQAMVGSRHEETSGGVS
ncbi:MAG: sigma-70 family RNA polymerase sigma factor [Actinomycetota bacterium]